MMIVERWRRGEPFIQINRDKFKARFNSSLWEMSFFKRIFGSPKPEVKKQPAPSPQHQVPSHRAPPQEEEEGGDLFNGLVTLEVSEEEEVEVQQQNITTSDRVELR